MPKKSVTDENWMKATDEEKDAVAKRCLLAAFRARGAIPDDASPKVWMLAFARAAAASVREESVARREMKKQLADGLNLHSFSIDHLHILSTVAVAVGLDDEEDYHPYSKASAPVRSLVQFAILYRAAYTLDELVTDIGDADADPTGLEFGGDQERKILDLVLNGIPDDE